MTYLTFSAHNKFYSISTLCCLMRGECDTYDTDMEDTWWKGQRHVNRFSSHKLLRVVFVIKKRLHHGWTENQTEADESEFDGKKMQPISPHEFKSHKTSSHARLAPKEFQMMNIKQIFFNSNASSFLVHWKCWRLKISFHRSGISLWDSGWKTEKFALWRVSSRWW